MQFPIERPSWPANHRAALSVIVMVPDQTTPTRLPPDPGLEYTPTGTQHLLAAFADADIPASIVLPPDAVDAAPDLPQHFAAAGHELAANLTAVTNDSSGDTPGFSWATGAVTALPGATPAHAPSVEARWVADGTSADGPTIGEGQQITMPLSSFWLDTTWLNPRQPLPPSSLLEHWSVSLADVRARGGMMTIVLHPHVAGRPGITSQIMRFIDEAIDCGDVWIATAGNLAEWWLREQSDST